MKSKFDIDHICSLAHLELTEKEKERLAPQLEKIVGWVGKLEGLNLPSFPGEVYCPVSFSLPFREDTLKPSLPLEEVLLNSPDKDKHFIKVPRVIEEK